MFSKYKDKEGNTWAVGYRETVFSHKTTVHYGQVCVSASGEVHICAEVSDADVCQLKLDKKADSKGWPWIGEIDEPIYYERCGNKYIVP